MKENGEVWKGIISAEDYDAFKIKMKELRENNVSQQLQYHVHICSCTSMRPSNGCHAITLSVIFWDYLSPGRLGKNVTAAF